MLLKKHYPAYTSIKKISIKDTVSAEQNNNQLHIVLKNKKAIGFFRKINTTTGCNSACLPIIYTSFFNEKGEYIELFSPPGLTKIYHAPMTTEDLARLDFILAMSPPEFEKIKDPKEMTDAISGETLKQYKEMVVEGAAYSTLRISMYHRETQKYIKDYLAKQSK